MIIDGFTFFNELDVLDIRLEELYPVVDRFILVESNVTFRGQNKPYYFEENKDRYTKYLDKIVHVKVIDPGTHSKDPKIAPWDREKYQRNAIMRGLFPLPSATLNPVIIISDVDEIIRRESVDEIARLARKGTVTIGMNMYYYGLNVYDGNAWGGAKATTNTEMAYRGLQPETLRHSDPEFSVNNAGWHFSYLGDEQNVINKIKAFSHWELDTPQVTDLEAMRQRMLRGEDVWGHGKKYEIVPVDDTYPHAVRNNMLYYRKYIKE